MRVEVEVEVEVKVKGNMDTGGAAFLHHSF